MNELSVEQRDAFDCVASYLHPTQEKQLLAIWAGEGGVGKSHVLRAVALHVRLQHTYKAVVICAVTNRAANLVGGVTVESLFHFSSMRAVNTKSGLAAWAQSVLSVRTRFEQVKVICVDESSVVSLEGLYDMHIILEHAFPEHRGQPFAGKSVILIGDYYQLPPVQGHVPYKNPLSSHEKAWRGRELLAKYFVVYSEFTTPNYRQRGDPEYCEICRHARYATAPTDAMLQALNARVVSIEQAKQRTKQTALWTATTHKVKDALNQSQLEDMERNGATFINVYAKHFHVQTSAAGGKRKRVSSGDSNQGDDDFSDCNEDRARSSGNIHSSERRTLLEHNPFLNADGTHTKLAYFIRQSTLLPFGTFAVGCRVSLTKHMHKALNLIKGARGTVISAVYDSDSRTYGPIYPGAGFEDAVASQQQLQIPLVLVQFDEGDYNGESCLHDVPRVVPIYAEKHRFTFNGVEYEREMLPLKLSLADTVHSAQGSSVKEHVMVPPIGRYDDFARGLIYVALSRVTKLSGLYLIGHNLTTQMFTKWAHQIKAINAEYARLRALPHWRSIIAFAVTNEENEDIQT